MCPYISANIRRMKAKQQELATATPAERLKYIRQKVRLTRSYIGKKYELSAATLKSWENGANRLTEKGLKLAVDFTGTKYWEDDDLN